MGYGVVDTKVVAHDNDFVACFLFVRGLDFDSQQFPCANFFDRSETLFVDEVAHYCLSFWVASLRLVGYQYLN